MQTNRTGINFTGLGSGIDTESIVRQLVRLENAPLQRLQAQRSNLSTQRDAYAQFRTQLTGLRSSVSGMARSGAFNIAQSTNTNSAAIRVTGAGTNGNFEINVNRLASAHSVASKGFRGSGEALGLQGTFQINNRQIAVGEDDTLEGLRDKINESDAGVRANILESSNGLAYLTVTSMLTGAANQIRFNQFADSNVLGFSDPVPVTSVSTVGSGSTVTVGSNPTPPAPPTLSTAQRDFLAASIFRPNIHTPVANRLNSRGIALESSTARDYQGQFSEYVANSANTIRGRGGFISGLTQEVLNALGGTNQRRLVQGVLNDTEATRFAQFLQSEGKTLDSKSDQEVAFEMGRFVVSRLGEMGPTDEIAWNRGSTAATAFDSISSNTAMPGGVLNSLLNSVLDRDATPAFAHFVAASGMQMSSLSVENTAKMLHRFMDTHARSVGVQGTFEEEGTIGASAARMTFVAKMFEDPAHNGFEDWAVEQGLNVGDMSDSKFYGVLAAYAIDRAANQAGRAGELKSVLDELASSARNWTPQNTLPSTPVTTPPSGGSTSTTTPGPVVVNGERIGSNILQALGFASGRVYNATDGIATNAFGSASASLSAFDGIGAGSFRFKVNGQELTVQTDTDSLESLARRITDLAGVSARVVNDSGQFQLQVVGNNGNLNLEDTDGLFEKLGAFARTTTLTEAADAQFSVNGVNMTSSSNEVTNAIQGATLSLLASGQSATIGFAKNADSAVNMIKGFVGAVNAIEGFLKERQSFNSATFESGRLFADNVSRQVSETITNALFGNVSVSSRFRNITQIGMSRDAGGQLRLDEASLRNVLDGGEEAMNQLFNTRGSTNAEGLRFVSATNETKASDSGYDVEITRLATQTVFTAGRPQSSTRTEAEKLTFSGTLFGSTPVELELAAGTSLDDTVQAINSDSRLSGRIVAENDNGVLRMRSSRFGSASEFNVTSDRSASSSNSGIGEGSANVRVVGTDIAGKINGEETAGMGQMLIGRAGNSTTDGLQLEYSGTRMGQIGKMTVEKGIGARIGEALDSLTKSGSGLLAAFDNAMESQMEDIDRQMNAVQTRSKMRELELRSRFKAMEDAMAKSQSQMAKLQSFMASQQAQLMPTRSDRKSA